MIFLLKFTQTNLRTVSFQINFILFFNNWSNLIFLITSTWHKGTLLLVENPGGLYSANFILWCSPWGYYFLQLYPPRKILLIPLMRTRMSHSVASSQFGWPVISIRIFKNWSKILLFFFFCYFFFSLSEKSEEKNWEKRFAFSWWTGAWYDEIVDSLWRIHENSGQDWWW